jgi:YYY domain-containing protein
MEYGLVLLWYVAFQTLSLLGLPLAAAMLPDGPRAAAAFSPVVALLAVSVVVYWLGHLAFGLPTVLVGLVVLAVGAVVALWRGGSEWVVGSTGLRAYAEAGAVFAVGFLMFVGIRVVDPAIDPASGEMFLDFGLLQTHLRSSVLPPEDMWFAGERLRYYYGGHLVAAELALLTDTPGRYAYNLALAGYFGLIVTSAYGLAAAIGGDHGADERVAGGVAAFVAALASNLYTPVRLLVDVLPDILAVPIGAGLATKAHIEAVDEFFYHNAAWLVDGAPTPFPLLSFLVGDMRPQTTGIPFLLLVAALCYAVYRTPAERRRRRAGLLAALVPAVAFLALVNTWALPTAGGLVALALLFAPARTKSILPEAVAGPLAARLPTAEASPIGAEAARIVGAVAVAVVVAGAAVVTAYPFFARSVGGRSVGFLPERTRLAHLLLVYGAFLVVFVPYLARRADSVIPDRRADVLVIGSWLLLVAGWVAGAAVLGLTVPLIAAGWLVCRRGGDVGFETVLIVAGAGLVLLVELLYVSDGAAPGRFNTMVKTTMQVWPLWAVAAGVVLARFLDVTDPVPTRWHPRVDSRQRNALLVAVLLVTLSLYGGLALRVHTIEEYPYGGPDHRVDDPSLDGTAYVATEHPHEGEAIRWLDDRPGQPTIVTEPGFSIYSWVSAPATLTGIPTVLGWQHQVDYHGNDPYDERVHDVANIYAGPPSERAGLLRKYDVRYVYVGPGERERYTTYDYADDPGISVAFENENVTIYRVEQAELESN